MPTADQLPIAGETFDVSGHSAFVIKPQVARERCEWVWYAPVVGKIPDPAERWMFEQLVSRGFAIAGVDVGESYGSPAGRRVFSSLHSELVARHGFSSRPRLHARSRGGLMLYNWAAENPACVSRIAGVYPVCDLRSFPRLERASAAYGMTPEALASQLSQHNPIDRLAPLAAAGVRIFHIHGDRDQLVPLDANSLALKRRYDALGGEMTLRIVEGGTHDMWPGWFECEELLDFLTTDRPSSERA